MTVAYTLTTDPRRLTVVVASTRPRRDEVYTIEVADERGEVVAKQELPAWLSCDPLSPSVARSWEALGQRMSGRHPKPQPRLEYSKADVGGLEPATGYRIVVRSESGEEADCWGATMPDSGTDQATFVFASCHGIKADATKGKARARFLADAYRTFEQQAVGPMYNLWLGDQIYLDDPWQHGWKPTVDPHREIIQSYQETLGLLGHVPSGLPRLLDSGSNWFLPDDHEFWNNYPRASLVTLPFHTLPRVAEQVKRFFVKPSEPPHPYHHGGWGRTAGAAYMAFQSADRQPFNDFGDEVSPGAVQTIELANTTVALVDTRWRRTMRVWPAPGRSSGFMPEEDFDNLARVLDRNHLVVLGLAKPIIGYLASEGPFVEDLEIGPEHYRRQYRKLWMALNRRARRNLPTLVLAGDVHNHSARLALDSTLAEFVCSPMSLIDSLDVEKVQGSVNSRSHSAVSRLASGAKKGKAWVARRLNRAVGAVRSTPRPKGDHLYHIIDGEENWSYGNAVQLYPTLLTSDDARVEERSGLGSLDIDTTNGDPVVRFNLVMQDDGSPSSNPGYGAEDWSVELKWQFGRWVTST